MKVMQPVEKQIAEMLIEEHFEILANHDLPVTNATSAEAHISNIYCEFRSLMEKQYIDITNLNQYLSMRLFAIRSPLLYTG